MHLLLSVISSFITLKIVDNPKCNNDVKID